jgi:hypothetical protein
MKIGCLIMSLGRRYKKMGQVAKDSFLKFHPDVDLFHVTDENIDQFASGKRKSIYPVGVLKYVLAAEIMVIKKYDKLIVLGSDTITCARLDEFLDNNDKDFLATLDYPYQFQTIRAKSPDHETHLNADVICFNSVQPIFDIIKVSQYHKIYYEQGGLNEVAWSSKYSHTFDIVDGPYETSEVVYNARAKGNIVAETNTKPFGKYVRKFYVKNEKLFTHDNKQIKVWHYCDGLGGLTDRRFEELVNLWIFGDSTGEWFNKETKEFFTNVCDAKDFFTKEFKI